MAFNRVAGARRTPTSISGSRQMVRAHHTYSTYARGLEAFVGTYSLLNVVPKGRDEDALDWGMAWVRRRDEYEEEQGEA